MFKKIINYFINFEKKIIENFNQTQIKLWNIFIFLLIFAIFSSMLHFLIWINWQPLFFQKLTAQIVSEILNFLGLNTISFGEYIRINGFGIIKIVKDCLGWKSFVALSGLIISTRKVRWKNKLLGILMGLLLIILGNVVRLVTTIYFGAKHIVNFEIIHTIIWQWGLTFFILIIWLMWLKYFSEKKINL